MYTNSCQVLHHFKVMGFQTLVLICFVCSSSRACTVLRDGVHIAFAYGSHFQQRSSDIDKLRGHDLLMWNTLICISHVAFVMQMLELCQGNTSICIQIGGNPTEMFS